MSDAEVRAFRARGVILSGGPESVTDANPPRAARRVYELGVPVLGICYGMQTMAQQAGRAGHAGGRARVRLRGSDRDGRIAPARSPRGPAQSGGGAVLDVWMSHGDRVDALPQGFVANAATSTIRSPP